jgi:hypothetical protein
MRLDDSSWLSAPVHTSAGPMIGMMVVNETAKNRIH